MLALKRCRIQRFSACVWNQYFPGCCEVCSGRWVVKWPLVLVRKEFYGVNWDHHWLLLKWVWFPGLRLRMVVVALAVERGLIGRNFVELLDLHRKVGLVGPHLRPVTLVGRGFRFQDFPDSVIWRVETTFRLICIWQHHVPFEPILGLNFFLDFKLYWHWARHFPIIFKLFHSLVESYFADNGR